MDVGIERLIELRVANVMTKGVITVLASQDLPAVSAIFFDNGISAAPVVDDHGVCVGMLSGCDFLFRGSDEGGGAEGQTAGTMMSPSVQSIDAGASLVAAARMMCTAHLHHLPVIDENSRPIGILSTLDVVAAMVNVVDEVKSGLGE